MNYLARQIDLQTSSDIPDIKAKEINGTLYFTIDRGERQKQYWQTNGTPQGTLLVMSYESEGKN